MSNRQIILDTETTGLSTDLGHRIIEIGCVELINRQFTGNHFHQYLYPDRQIDAGAFNVHGLSLEFLADKPRFHDIVKEFISFIDGAELIIHNAPFDIGFLNYEFALSGKQYKKMSDYCRVFDTLLYARKKHPGQQNNLDALCKRYKVDHSDRNLHGALLDANLLAEVYLAMTGGQTSLFAQTSKPQQNKEKIEHIPTAQNHENQSKIIYANADELLAHDERLKSIQSASGYCAWLTTD